MVCSRSRPCPSPSARGAAVACGTRHTHTPPAPLCGPHIITLTHWALSPAQTSAAEELSRAAEGVRAELSRARERIDALDGEREALYALRDASGANLAVQVRVKQGSDEIPLPLPSPLTPMPSSSITSGILLPRIVIERLNETISSNGMTRLAILAKQTAAAKLLRHSAWQVEVREILNKCQRAPPRPPRALSIGLGFYLCGPLFPLPFGAGPWCALTLSLAVSLTCCPPPPRRCCVGRSWTRTMPSPISNCCASQRDCKRS